MAARFGSDGHRRLPQQGLPPHSGLPGDGVQAAAVLLILEWAGSIKSNQAINTVVNLLSMIYLGVRWSVVGFLHLSQTTIYSPSSWGIVQLEQRVFAV